MSKTAPDTRRLALKRLFSGSATEEEMDKAFGLDEQGQRREQRKHELESNFYEFVKDAFAVLHPGKEMRTNWHIEYICQVLQAEIERINRGEPKTQDVIINVPPRSLKSFITTICLPAWAWALNPSLKFIAASYNAELSTQHCVAGRRIVSSEWFREYWGDTVVLASDQDEKKKFENTRHGLRMATSTGGGVTGGGADVVIYDDPTNPKQAASDVEREEANTFFTETLSTRLDNPETGLFVIVQQRLHTADLTGHLLENEPEKWFHICLPVELTPDVAPPELAEYYEDGLLFPGRFSTKVLDTQRGRLGSYGYAGQMLQRPTAAGGGILKSAWFKRITVEQFAEVFKSVTTPAGRKLAVFGDLAYTEKKQNDPSALMALVYMNNTLYILSSVAVRKEFPDLLAYVPKFLESVEFPRNTPIRIEPKASGLSLISSLQREGYNAIALPPTRDDKVARATAAAPAVEAGRVVLVTGPWVTGFCQECDAFPNGTHDDQVDNLTAAVAHFMNKPAVQRTHGSMRI